MKPIILTGHTKQMQEIADLCLPSVRAWAAKHGCECVVLTDTDFPTEQGHPSFQKLRHLESLIFFGTQPVIWLDTDVLITNDSMSPESLLPTAPDFLRVSRDYTAAGRADHLAWSAGVMAWMPVQEAFEWLSIAQRDQRAKWHGLWDQDALQRSQPAHGVCISPPHFMNAVSPRVPNADEPAKWSRGDLLCHFTGFPLADRPAVIRKFLTQL